MHPTAAPVCRGARIRVGRPSWLEVAYQTPAYLGIIRGFVQPGPLAQVVEHRAFNPLVEGSSPSRPTNPLNSPSRAVQSNQPGPHRRLDQVVARHRDSAWRAPIHPASRSAYACFVSSLDRNSPLVLDSGCGTAWSTARLAERYPEATVIGVDQSAARLARFCEPELANMRRIRARAEDFWRLLAADGIRPARHFLLYPNPWPKAAHLRRRWHGHPVFPDLLALGGVLELRTNWQIYAEEFCCAAGICGIDTPPVVSFSVDSPLTPFERKYAESGHRLYRLCLNLEKEQ